ncbi:MAG: tyrosine-type recombinase/integrase, partial [Candidatus Nanohaloarchaea archaeon]|nr:tyrosine-type recombinase/integrase [Candidatus Nanohaloarchaea archaeon]
KTDPAELPTPEDVRRMLKAARNTRDRALLFTLWDTGGRIGEVLNLEWRDVHFDQDLTEVRFRESKTGERIVPVRECVPALKEWREKHPKADDTNAYVFVAKNTSTAEGEAYEKQLSYRKALDVVKYVDDKGGVGKDLSPHDFRKGRATWLASQGMNAAQLMEYFGWNQMETAETYVRLAKKDLENAVREIQGMETDENGAEPVVEDLKPVRCGTCETINAADHDFCTDCGNPLAQRAGLLQTSKKREIRENVKTDMLMEFLQEMGIPEDEARERFDQMTDTRMEKQGLM